MRRVGAAHSRSSSGCPWSGGPGSGLLDRVGSWLWAPCARPHGHCLHSLLSFKLPKEEDYLTFFKNVVSSSQVVLVLKNPPANAGDVRDPGLIPGLGRSSGGGHGNPLQYSGLENPMNRIP